jgi:hypothetical protein
MILCLLLVAATGCEKKAAPKEPAAAPAPYVTPAPAAAEPAAEKLAAGAKTAAADAGEPADAPGVITVSSREVEVGCGMCIYAIKGVTSCSLAAKIDGKPYMVKGSSVNAHKAGLCGGTKLAKCEGRIEGDTFFATRLVLKE